MSRKKPVEPFFKCAKCGDAAYGANSDGGREYVRGWVDGHLPRCDPDQYLKVRFGVPPALKAGGKP